MKSLLLKNCFKLKQFYISFGYDKIWAKIRDTFFFIRAESHVKGVKISLEKNRLFLAE